MLRKTGLFSRRGAPTGTLHNTHTRTCSGNAVNSPYSPHIGVNRMVVSLRSASEGMPVSSREAHASDEVLEAGTGVQRIESGHRFQAGDEGGFFGGHARFPCGAAYSVSVAAGDWREIFPTNAVTWNGGAA